MLYHFPVAESFFNTMWKDNGKLQNQHHIKLSVSTAEQSILFGFHQVHLKFCESKNNQDDTAVSSVLSQIYSLEGTGSPWEQTTNLSKSSRISSTGHTTYLQFWQDNTELPPIMANLLPSIQDNLGFFPKPFFPCFGGLFTATRLHITVNVFRSPVLQEHEHRHKTSIDGFHYTMWNSSNPSSPLLFLPTPQKWNVFLF